MSKKIIVQDILELFKKGISRYKSQDQGVGSVEEMYNLTEKECEILFSHPKIKGKKVKTIQTVKN